VDAHEKIGGGRRNGGGHAWGRAGVARRRWKRRQWGVATPRGVPRSKGRAPPGVIWGPFFKIITEMEPTIADKRGPLLPHPRIHRLTSASDHLRARNAFSFTVIWYSICTMAKLNPRYNFRYNQCILLCEQYSSHEIQPPQ
jgi:hypothetical protein